MIVEREEGDWAPTPQPWPTTHRLVQPKKVPPPAAPLDVDEFRELRFGPESQKIASKETRPFAERSKREFAQVIEEFRAEQKALQERPDFAAQYE
jgi:hypothetical protein